MRWQISRRGCARAVPPGNQLGVCETAAPSLPKGQSLIDAIQNRERRIRELQSDARRVEASPLPAACVRQRMKDQISAIAARGAPNVSRLIQADGDIESSDFAR
jgi:hypothetical protein